MELEEAKEEVKKWVREEMMERYAKNLAEIGGTGIPISYFKKGKTAPPIEIALESAIIHLWYGASMCYMFGLFRESAVSFIFLVEAVLKLQLEKKGIPYNKDRCTLGCCIGLCEENGILTKVGVDAANKINKMRNDLAHFNIERKDPKKAMFKSPYDEMKPVESFPGGYIGEKYKVAAGEAKENVEKILRLLYPD